MWLGTRLSVLRWNPPVVANWARLVIVCAHENRIKRFYDIRFFLLHENAKRIRNLSEHWTLIKRIVKLNIKDPFTQ